MSKSWGNLLFSLLFAVLFSFESVSEKERCSGVLLGSVQDSALSPVIMLQWDQWDGVMLRLMLLRLHPKRRGAGPGTTFPAGDLMIGGFSSVSISQRVQVRRGGVGPALPDGAQLSGKPSGVRFFFLSLFFSSSS